MRIHFFGHATLGITAQDGTRLLIDPYEPGGFGGKMNYPAIPAAFDVVVCSHGHPDHCAVSHIQASTHLESGIFGPFLITRVRLDHDEYQGERFGGQVDALIIEVDGLRLCHLSDVGHSPTRAHIEALGSIDILFVPVGGFYTIGSHQALSWVRRIQAHTSIPIHYRTSLCTLPFRGIDPFLALVGEYKSETRGFIDVGSVDALAPVILLNPAPEDLSHHGVTTLV